MPDRFVKGQTAAGAAGSARCSRPSSAGTAMGSDDEGGARGPALDEVAIAAHAGSADSAGDPGRRQHAGVRQEPQSRRGHRARDVPRDAASGEHRSGPRTVENRLRQRSYREPARSLHRPDPWTRLRFRSPSSHPGASTSCQRPSLYSRGSSTFEDGVGSGTCMTPCCRDGVSSASQPA